MPLCRCLQSQPKFGLSIKPISDWLCECRESQIAGYLALENKRGNQDYGMICGGVPLGAAPSLPGLWKAMLCLEGILTGEAVRH